MYEFVVIWLIFQWDCSKSWSDHMCGEKVQRRLNESDTSTSYCRIVYNSTFVILQTILHWSNLPWLRGVKKCSVPVYYCNQGLIIRFPRGRTIIEHSWHFVNPYQLIQLLQLFRIDCFLIWTFSQFHPCHCGVISCLIYQIVLQLCLRNSPVREWRTPVIAAITK